VLTFYQYPKCSTCRKAKQWLDVHEIAYESKHIVEQTPSVEEIRTLVTNSGLPIQKFFNTSGQVYRQQGLSKKLPSMSDDEKIALLASNGMLLKRPIVTDGHHVTVGFKETEWDQIWAKQKATT
jgi:arsenate reductase